MLNTYNTSSQTVAVNANLSFDTNSVSTNCNCINHTEGSSVIKLNKSGIYLVTFNGIAAATETATSPITIQLFNGTNEIAYATASTLSESATDFVNLFFSVLIEVNNSCCIVDNTKSLTIQNTGIEANFTNVNLSIVKIK